jgi:tripartite-type tricarboxylate transporter receptor subunit TctC
VVIDNRGGAGGTIGAEAAAKAAPDGYTIMMGHLGTLAVAPAIYRKLGYDPRKSFAPVALMALVPSVLVVNPRVLPVSSAEELIAYARAWTPRARAPRPARPRSSAPSSRPSSSAGARC